MEEAALSCAFGQGVKSLSAEYLSQAAVFKATGGFTVGQGPFACYRPRNRQLSQLEARGKKVGAKGRWKGGAL